MKLVTLLPALLGAVTIVPAHTHDIIRHANPNVPIATSVVVPAGADMLFVSGTLADVADPAAPAGSIERLGDTATQAKSVLGKIAKELESAGFTARATVAENMPAENMQTRTNSVETKRPCRMTISPG